MRKYLLEVIKVDQSDGSILDSWDLFSYPTRKEAIEEAKTVCDSSINPRVLGYTNVLVHELVYDNELEAPIESNQIASFDIK